MPSFVPGCGNTWHWVWNSKENCLFAGLPKSSKEENCCRWADTEISSFPFQRTHPEELLNINTHYNGATLGKQWDWQELLLLEGTCPSLATGQHCLLEPLLPLKCIPEDATGISGKWGKPTMCGHTMLGCGMPMLHEAQAVLFWIIFLFFASFR